MSREKSIKTININLEKLTALELEEVTVLTNALLAVRNVREEHQAKISGYTEEIQRLEYKAKEFQESAELTAQEVHKLRDANKQLKSQLEKQQPEIPEFVGKYIKETADPIHEMCAWSEHYGDNGTKCDDPELSKMLDWFGMNRNMFYEAVIKGYTVKEKLFYLKNKLTGLYLCESKKGFFEQENPTLELTRRCDFNQQEIDSMETGSYEQIEAEE